MQIGTCRLCLTPDLELQDSHFVPRAFYKLFIERGGPGSQPVTASQEKSMFSGKQASDYLLCRQCEGRFNFGGESWVIANCWHSPEDFPLRTRLLEIGPVRGNVKTFAAFDVAGGSSDRPRRARPVVVSPVATGAEVVFIQVGVDHGAVGFL